MNKVKKHTRKLLMLGVAAVLSFSLLACNYFNFEMTQYLNIPDINNISVSETELQERIDARILTLRRSQSTWGDPERAVEDGDFVTFEFSGVINFLAITGEIEGGHNIVYSFLITVDEVEDFSGDRRDVSFHTFPADDENDNDNDNEENDEDYENGEENDENDEETPLTLTQIIDEIIDGLLGTTPSLDQAFTRNITIPENFADDEVAGEDAVIEITILHHFEGEFFDGGTGSIRQDQNFRIGGETFIPGFEDEMIGLYVDQLGLVEVTFPEDYPQNRDLEEEDAVFFTVIRSVEILPELDDEFINEHTDSETYEEWMTETTDNLRAGLAFEYIVDNSYFPNDVFPRRELLSIYNRMFEHHRETVLWNIDWQTGQRRFRNLHELAAAIGNEVAGSGSNWTIEDLEMHTAIEAGIELRQTMVIKYMASELGFELTNSEFNARLTETIEEAYEVQRIRHNETTRGEFQSLREFSRNARDNQTRENFELSFMFEDIIEWLSTPDQVSVTSD